MYTDHKNLVHKTHVLNSERVMRWRLLLKEYGVIIKYIKGEENILTDTISRYPLQESTENNFNLPELVSLITVEEE